MVITATMVKDLRAKTGAGMMNCKKALLESEGNFELAIDWLKKKGLSAAVKKSGRIAAEGLTALYVEGNKAAAIEINSETDFVAKNKVFQDMSKEISKIAIMHEEIDSLKDAKTSSGKSVKEEIISNIATIGENLNIRRMKSISVNEGVIASYVHNAVADNMGKISVLVALESSGDKAKLMELGKQIAMHIAAAKPDFLDKDSVNSEVIQREKDIFIEQSKESGKPDNIIEKMVEGRIRKFLEEIVLLEQTFVIDGKSKLSDVVSNLAKELGTSIALKSYIRFELGEGIKKEAANFADEVSAITGN